MPASPQYRCPGQHYAISRSVHLARLAAHYPGCAHCRHREEAQPASGASHGPGDGFPRVAVPNVQSGSGAMTGPARLGGLPPGESIPDARPSLIRTNGIRGQYLNELTRQTASEIAGAFASLIWRGEPGAPSSVTSAGPSVVVAFDERPSSTDLVVGAAAALRRMGCQVIDIGLSTRPCFWFAVRHLQATAGLFVSGSGHDAATSGLDFVGAEGVPLSSPGLLDDVVRIWQAGHTRPSRHPGSQRSYQAWGVYEAGLPRHYHALRPLHVVAASPNATVCRLLARLFHRLACQLTLVATPVRGFDLLDPHDPDIRSICRHVRALRADLGAVIGDDGQRTVFLDETGAVVPPLSLLDLLTPIAVREHRGKPVVRWPGDSGNFAEISTEIASQDACFGGDRFGYVWVRDPHPFITSDAAVTLPLVLQSLSSSDLPFSAAVRQAGGLPVDSGPSREAPKRAASATGDG